MLLFPECQLKAQHEIDTVVGFSRLPEFHDRETLPYLECLIQETMRCVCSCLYNSLHSSSAGWQVEPGRSTRSAIRPCFQELLLIPNALGVPHRSMEDDMYNGMFIPKDSIIIANTRSDYHSCLQNMRLRTLVHH